MYDKAFEDLLKEYLTDGIITSKEREVLLRKAQELHYDVDEVDLYIDAQQQKYEQAAEAASAKKLGKVCPRCGKQVSELTVVCDCGYEFQDNKSEPSAIDILTDRIEKIRAQPINCLRSSPEYEKALAEKNNKIAETIANCAVPNTKKGIIDFLSVAMANSTIKGMFWGTWSGRVKGIITLAIILFLLTYWGAKEYWFGYEASENPYSYYLMDVLIVVALSFVAFKYNKSIISENEIALAWRGKVTQTLIKGHSLQGDEEFSRQLDYFENQFNEKCKSSLVKILEVIFENLKKAFGGIKAYAEERQEAKKQAKELAKKQAEEQAKKQSEEQTKEQAKNDKAIDNK